ncbi:MAG: hypothetical protein V4687_03750 [Bacteroidota bacterium]
MKRNRLLFASILVLLFFSCQKEKELEVTEFHEKLLTRITESRGNLVTVTSFSYDEKKRLSTIKKGDELTTYTYTGNQLTAILSVEGTRKTFTELSYEDDCPKKGVSTIFESGTLLRTLDYHLVTSLSGTEQINVTDKGVLTRRLYFQYDNSNITEILDLQNRTLTTYDFRYGSKKNILFNANIRWAMGIEKIDRMSTNEVLREISEVNSKKHIKSYVYTYDADLFPVTAIITETDPPSILETKTTVTYTYEVL